MYVLAGAIAMAGITVPVAESAERHACEDIGPGRIVNSVVYPGNVPTCDDGRLILNTPRADLVEDAYGWNCYLDGDGICGPLPPSDKGCLTDPDDGYTMCWDGRTYYRNASGTKLSPVVYRAPTE